MIPIKQVIKLIIPCLLCLLLGRCTLPEKTTTVLNFTSGWEFFHDSVWYPANVPGTIHTDLINNKLIKDPYWGTNEDSVQWVSYHSWQYRTRFNKEDIFKYANAAIVFEGLDTYAEVYLNGKLLSLPDGSHTTDNMFRRWIFPLPGDLIKDSNELIVKFISSVLVEQSKATTLPYPVPEIRALSRKSPYQSGWDWGPKLVTCGIWKKAYIKLWNDFQIDDFQIFQSQLSKDFALLNLRVKVDASCKCESDIHLFVDGKLNKIIRNYNLSEGENLITHNIKITRPELWYPNGMGAQKLYNIKVEMKSNLSFDSVSHNVGLRTVELRFDPDSIGKKFEFYVNGIPVFMKGVNWIPGEFFPSQMTSAKYKALISSCRDANMNMLRIWGGGIYEDDIFYDLCDQYGILVWQDFIFAGALYPLNKNFIRNISIEAEEQVKRLRNHPCLAIWCGNNEVKNAWEDWGWKDNYSQGQKKLIEHDINFLFDTILRRSVNQHDYGRSYVSTSPLWGWGHPECVTHGNSHYWGVWWGDEPFEVWDRKTGRFMTEYGFQSYPELSTIKQFAAVEEMQIESAVLKNHQKHSRGVEIINNALNRYFRNTENFEEYLYLSQLVQAYGIGEAIETHRRERPHCMGSLYWQLNDCWPVASWSSIDYYGNWKALHYTARNKFAGIIISTKKENNDVIPIYIISDSLIPITGKLELLLMDFSGIVLDSMVIPSIKIPANSSTFIANYDVPDKYLKKIIDNILVIKYISENGKLMAQKVHYFDFPGKLNLMKPHITIKKEIIGKKILLHLKSDYMAKGVFISSIQNISGKYSDNYFDLLPNEEKTIYFSPSNDIELKKIEFTFHSFYTD